jgi:mRNA interferase MazF
MKRGAIVQTQHGPVLIIQSDLFYVLNSVTVLPFSPTSVEAPIFRLTIDPTPLNGFASRHFLLVDKAFTLHRDSTSHVLGFLDDHQLVAVNRALTVFLGIA